jgi:hypothetical protein
MNHVCYTQNLMSTITVKICRKPYFPVPSMWQKTKWTGMLQRVLLYGVHMFYTSVLVHMSSHCHILRKRDPNDFHVNIWRDNVSVHIWVEGSSKMKTPNHENSVHYTWILILKVHFFIAFVNPCPIYVPSKVFFSLIPSLLQKS